MRKRIQIGIVSLVFAIALAGMAHAAPNTGNTASSNVKYGPIVTNGGVYGQGSSSFNKIGAPSVPVITQVGTAGSTSYTYYCSAEDINGIGSSVVVGGSVPGQIAGETAPSSSATTTTGNATLSTTNYNTVYCPGKVGAVAFRVFKADTSHMLGVCFTSSGQGCSVNDQSTSAGTSITANTIDTTGMTLNNQMGCGGTVKVVAGAVEVTAPCISNYTSCAAVPMSISGAATPVAGELAACSPTSTATVINSATVTVGAVQIYTAGTPSPSPQVTWFGVQ